MPLPLAPIAIGAALGGGSSLLGGGKSGEDAGNVFNRSEQYNLLGMSDYAMQKNIQDAMNANRGLTMENAATDVQSNPLLSQLFGSQGAMQRAGNEEQQLASRGYSLQPEDHEAYGQASGNIARMFGQSEQSLAQSLADRGMSQSGIAGQEFSGLLGNKQEQLAGLQTKIADNRMKMNMDRLAQTRQFLGQMGGQAQQAMGQSLDTTNTRNQNMINNSMNYLNARQGGNERAKGLQQSSAQEGPNFGSFMRGAIGGGLAGGQLGGALSGAPGQGTAGAVSGMFEPGRRVLA